MLKSKCIYDKPCDDDGLRISIMSRHTLDDGITPDENIHLGLYHLHRSDLAPPPSIVGGYLKGRFNYDTYRHLYLTFLKELKFGQVVCIVKQSLLETITILCKEQKPDYCHRKIFVEFAQDVAKQEGVDLVIDIK
ncbi:MAG: DUF488 family protein [Candidatus Absconditabacteria bacterium]